MIGYGFGKTILFGEHFVVYNYPAIVVSLPLVTTATLIDYSGSFIVDERIKCPNFVSYKYDLYEAMAQKITALIPVERKYSYLLSGTLPVTSGGIGASGAAAVAITRALQSISKQFFSLKDMLRIALQGENMIHGNGSGIDTTVAMVSGLLLFKKTKLDLLYKRIKDYKKIPFLLIDSGKTADTQKAINQVDCIKKTKIILWHNLVNEYHMIYAKALIALEEHNLVDLGKLFDSNQILLNQLGISCEQVDTIRNCANTFGSLGSKMTGSCDGGLVIVLGKDEKHLLEMTRSFSALGYFVINPSSQASIFLAEKKPSFSHI